MEKDSGATMATLQHAYNRVSAAVASARSKPEVEEEPFFDDDEAVLSRFHERYEDFTAEHEGANLEARERGMAMRSVLQDIVDESRDTDRPCHICVFGLMGHGKSRLMNLLITSAGNPPKGPAFSEVVEKVTVSTEVPSGSGCTTRAYSRHLLPAVTTYGSRFPFFLVDTIGVKFSDEFDPSPQELRSEFALVRQQLRGLDFRSRVGVFKETFDFGGGGRVNRGQDVMTIRPEKAQGAEDGVGWGGGEQTATVTLRGGQVVSGVPFSKLEDVDGGQWEWKEGKGFEDKRPPAQRLAQLSHALGWFQPKCQAAVLVTNPHQQVPERVYEEWRRVFSEAGFDEVPVIATHSDVVRVFGPQDAAEQARAAQQHLQRVHVNPARSIPQTVRLIENYTESTRLQTRRLLSEVQALDAFCIAARIAQRRERHAEGAGGISHIATGFFAATGLGLMALTGVHRLMRRAKR